MSEVLESVRSMIEARIGEIDAELAKLHRALASLDGDGTRSDTRTATRRHKPRRRKRAPHGQRREQLLAALRRSPGASAAELGREIGISTTQAYALAQRLVADGEIKKRGKGYRAS